MKRICASLFITALALLAVFPATQAKADTEITLNTFYDALEPQGDWIYVEDYGYCFRPFVSYDNADWQPYTEGYWAETDAGWTWVSDEDFGWATYHYGRWAEVGGYWVWVPGYDWAPAWVSWRNNDEYVGWAPLPPEARWEVGVGFHDWVDSYYDIGPSSYNFVPVRHFGAERCSTVIVDRRQNFGIISLTTNITNISYRSSGGSSFTSIYVGGPDYDRVNRYSERKIRRLTLRGDDRRDFDREEFRRGGFRNRIDDNAFTVFAPRVDRDKRDFSPAKVKARFDKNSIDRGWRNIDENKAREIRQKFDEDAKRGPNGRDRNDENFRRSVTAAPVVAKAPTPDIPRGTDRRRDGDRGPEGRPDRRGSDENTASTDRRDGNRRPGTGVDSEGKPVIPRAEVMPDGDSKSDRPRDPNTTAGRGRDGEGRERDGEGRDRDGAGKMPTARPDEKTASGGRRDGDRSRDGSPAVPRAEVLPEARTGRDGDGNGKMNPQRPDDLPAGRTDRPGDPAGGNARRNQDQNREGSAVPRAEVMPEGRNNPSGGNPETERRRPEMPERSKAETVRPSSPQTRPQEVKPAVPDQNRSNGERPEGRPGGPSGEMNRNTERRESGAGAARSREGASNSNEDAQRMQRQQQQAREAAQSQQSNDANRQRQAMQEAQRSQERQSANQREERSQPQSQQRQEQPRRESPQAQPQRREEPRRQVENQRPQAESQPQQRQERPGGGGGGGGGGSREGKRGGDNDDKKDKR